MKENRDAFKGEWVALSSGELVDHDVSRSALHARLLYAEKLDNSCLIIKVDDMKNQKKESVWHPQVLLLYEKHCTRVFNAITEEQLYASALTILKERFDDGLYHEQDDLFKYIKNALKTNDAKEAWSILRDRSDFEYERVELMKLESGE